MSTDAHSIDDGRLETLLTRISALIPACQDKDGLRTLLWSAVFGRNRHADFRVVSVALRLIGQLPPPPTLSPSGDASRSLQTLLFHTEPLIRLAVMSCALHWGTLFLDLRAEHWQQLLYDDSIYVQQQARSLFALYLIQHRVKACEQVLQTVLEEPSRDQRADLLLVQTIATNGPSWVDSALRPVERIMEKHFLSGGHPSILALSVLELAWSKMGNDAGREAVASDWLDQLMLADRYEDAAALCKSLSFCGLKSVVSLVSPFLLEKCRDKPTILVKLSEALGRSDGTVSACMFCVSLEKNRKCQLSALRLLAAWREPIETDLILRLLNENIVPLFKTTLTLRADWRLDNRLWGPLIHRLKMQDPWCSAEVWDCVARNQIAELVDSCVDSILGFSRDDAVLAHAWEGFISWLGPEHPAIPKLVQLTLSGSCASAAALAIALKWLSAQRTMDPTLQHQISDIAKRCLVQDEDWACVEVAVKWLARVGDGDAKIWMLKCLKHWARPVRQAAKLIAQAWGMAVEQDTDVAEIDDHFLLETDGNSVYLECCD